MLPRRSWTGKTARFLCYVSTTTATTQRITGRRFKSSWSIEALNTFCEQGRLREACNALKEKPNASSAKLLVQSLRHNWDQPGIYEICRDVEHTMQKHTLPVLARVLLIEIYLHLGKLNEAFNLATKLESLTLASHKKTRIVRYVWNAMMKLSTQKGQPETAVAALFLMKRSGFEPDAVAFTQALRACTQIGAWAKGKEIHNMIKRADKGNDVILQNNIVTMYIKAGDIVQAREVFDQMAERDVISWTVMMEGYRNLGKDDEVLNLWEELKKQNDNNDKKVQPDERIYNIVVRSCARPGCLAKAKQIHAQLNENTTPTTTISTQMYNTLINTYSKCGSVEDARSLFDELREKGRADIVTWNTLLHTYLTNNNPTETLTLFKELHQQQQHNNDNTLRCTSVTYGTVLAACAGIGKEALKLGEELHRDFVPWDSLKANAVLATSLVNMYGRCGKLEEAIKLFDQLLPHHGQTSTTFWTAGLHLHAEAKQTQKAKQLIERMLTTPEGNKNNKDLLTKKQIKEDAILLSVMLKVCAAVGDTELSKHLQQL